MGAKWKLVELFRKTNRRSADRRIIKNKTSTKMDKESIEALFKALIAEYKAEAQSENQELVEKVNKMRSEIDELKKENQSLRVEATTSTERVESYQKLSMVVNQIDPKEITQLKVSVSSLLTTTTKLQEQIDLINEELNAIRKAQNDTNVEQIVSNTSQAQNELRKLRDETQQIIQEIQNSQRSNNADLTILHGENDALKTKINELEQRVNENRLKNEEEEQNEYNEKIHYAVEKLADDINTLTRAIASDQERMRNQINDLNDKIISINGNNIDPQLQKGIDEINERFTRFNEENHKRLKEIDVLRATIAQYDLDQRITSLEEVVTQQKITIPQIFVELPDKPNVQLVFRSDQGIPIAQASCTE